MQPQSERHSVGQPDKVVGCIGSISLLKIVSNEQERLHGFDGSGFEHLKRKTGPCGSIVSRLLVL